MKNPSIETLTRRQQLTLAKLLSKRFRGRDGIVLVGRPPEFQVRSEDWDGRLTADQIRKLHLTGRACLGVYVVCQGDVCWFAAIDLGK